MRKKIWICGGEQTGEDVRNTSALAFKKGGRQVGKNESVSRKGPASQKERVTRGEVRIVE